jgi:hypothetical protein
MNKACCQGVNCGGCLKVGYRQPTCTCCLAYGCVLKHFDDIALVLGDRDSSLSVLVLHSDQVSRHMTCMAYR